MYKYAKRLRQRGLSLASVSVLPVLHPLVNGFVVELQSAAGFDSARHPFPCEVTGVGITDAKLAGDLFGSRERLIALFRRHLPPERDQEFGIGK